MRIVVNAGWNHSINMKVLKPGINVNTIMKLPGTIFILFLSVMPVLSQAEVFQSNGKHVSVLELYTSEGCSSCPPADRWLSSLKNDDRLWHELVPVAFHVDYWNYIGWTDRFSSENYSDRQRNYARSKGLSTVYTPGFLLNGKEWRSFFGLRYLSLDTDQDSGNLEVKVDKQNVQATYTSQASVTNPVLNVAVLGFDLKTQVKAGENRGKQLNHDFTVLGYKTVPMTPSDNGFISNSKLPEISTDAPRLGIAVWVNEQGDQAPIQATGGYLNE